MQLIISCYTCTTEMEKYTMNNINSFEKEKRKEMILASAFFAATVLLLYVMIQVSATINY